MNGNNTSTETIEIKIELHEIFMKHFNFRQHTSGSILSTRQLEYQSSLLNSKCSRT